MKFQGRNNCGLFAILLIISFLITECNAQAPEVTILQGTLQGLTIVTNSSKEVFGFLGIPYASPPVGDLRFSAPVPAAAWDGIFNATDDGSSCPQIYMDVLFGDEDCLSINVYTPKKIYEAVDHKIVMNYCFFDSIFFVLLQLPENNSALLPTMFYVYGGGFQTGYHNATRYGPGYLLKDDDVVLVVPNYRGGPLGFLSTGDEAAPGNFGLKDLTLALTWVKENIAFFGGDPDRVTIFGQSSGGAIVQYLSLSESTEGLFHAYISQSGSALASLTFVENEIAVERAFKFGTYFNCSSDTSTALISCLRTVDALEMITIANHVYSVDLDVGIPFVPTNEQDPDGAFLTDTPKNLFAAGKVRDLPWITGVAMDDGLSTTSVHYADPDLVDDFIADIDNMIPRLSGYLYDETIANKTAYTAALKNYYFSDLTANRSEILANMTHLFGDVVFIYPTFTAVQQFAAIAKNPVYLYVFNYLGVFSFSYIYAGTYEVFGVAHGDDIIYRFPQTEAIYSGSNDTMSATDMEMVDIAVELWTSFAINGAPSSSALSGSTWEPYSAAKNFLQIGNRSDVTLSIENDFFSERMLFWDELTESSAVETSSAVAFTSNSRLLSFILCSNIILLASRLQTFGNGE